MVCGGLVATLVRMKHFHFDNMCDVLSTDFSGYINLAITLKSCLVTGVSVWPAVYSVWPEVIRLNLSLGPNEANFFNITPKMFPNVKYLTLNPEIFNMNETHKIILEYNNLNYRNLLYLVRKSDAHRMKRCRNSLTTHHELFL